ncbi:MAG: hypothetical protein ACREOM_06860, partial [Candidatus Dormibacteraceae bacterium]
AQTVRAAAAFLIGLLVALAGAYFGVWWAPFVVGLAIGLVDCHVRIALPLGAAVGLLSWGLLLGMAQVMTGLGAAASSLAAIMGFGHQGVIPVVLTLVVGLLLGLTGGWLGSAGRSLVEGLQPAISR